MKRLLIISLILCVSSLRFSEAGVPPKYISLAPSTTEILFALGLDKEIVGVSSYCDYPPEAAKKEKVGSFSQPNIEKILYLKPDYIFCTGVEQANIVVQLRKLNLNVFVADPQNLGQLFASIREMGLITGRVKEAEIIVMKMKQDIKEISLKVELISKEQRPKVFFEIWHDPLMTAGNGSLIDEMLTTAGGINIASDINRPYSIFSAEEVIKRDPDCIIISYMDKNNPVDSVGRRFGWERIKAVKNKRIYNDIDQGFLLHPGPRTTQGIKEIYKRLYQ